jgi:ubiquinone/menaquinone biosynthesis C-methylase UbiE
MTSTLHPDKLEAQKQWDTDPCAAETVRDVERGTLEFYRRIRKHRYEQYGPWFPSVMRFDDFKNKDILEIGVGLGSDHYSFAKNGNRMTALDLSREHLRQTVNHLSLEGLTTNPVYGDAEDMPFPDNSFDVVYSFGVLMSTPNTAKAFSEVHRVLRPGGVAIISIYHRHSWFFWVQTFLINGIVKMGLRKGWRRLLADIEYRSDKNAAIPLVKVYSRRNIRNFCAPFSHQEITCCHVEHSNFSKFGILLRPLRRDQLERYLAFGGWYLVVRAYK